MRSPTLRCGPAALLPLLLIAACAGGAGAPEVHASWSRSAQDLVEENGLSLNGLATNGMSTNGLSLNGMSTNGLSTNGMSTNGMSTNGFAAWFTKDPAYSDQVMTYLVRCALPAGAKLSYKSGKTYVWQGDLGLAPTWASGKPIPEAEQQLITACLAAHANKFGVHVGISVRGWLPDGTPIGKASGELTAYPYFEGFFFGNLFTGDGVYSRPANSQRSYDPTWASPRACSMTIGPYSGCAPAITPETHDLPGVTCGSAAVGWTCTLNGKVYKALGVYLQASDVTTCGDGVCLFPETCYSAATGTGCAADCGTCK